MVKPPSQLADFEILHRLGAGGMAEVFLAKKRGAEGTYKLLVVKRILPAHGASRRFRSMFVEEAQLATRLNHPNIVQVYEFSDHGEEGLVLSMEYVEGFDLGRVISAARQQGARIPPLVAAFIVAEAAKGLHYAHERKDERGAPLAIVHRDISPQNILVSYEGAVKIADFGIAWASLFRDEPGVLKGKIGYMSPEQARRERVDRRSDIYALGVVLYELFTLRSPFGKLDDDALYEAVQRGDFLPPSAHVPDLPPELDAIAQKALSLRADDRFQTARDMAGAIARALLARQELVDNASVEQTLAMLVGRDLAAPAASDAQPRTLAAVRVPRSSDAEGQNTPLPGQGAPRLVREVRHVAVVALRIAGATQGEALGRARFAAIRAILDDIAYKRGAVFSWEAPYEEGGGPVVARAIVGLMANPSRAAADAAWLAVDVHEALAGASEDFPVPLAAAIGIVRGIATGERDAEGHLVNHALQEPANLLADRIGSSTPYGKTWVAGGIYRLVRRAFRWGDAPPIDIEEGAGRDVPRQMRPYVLERPLTREERLDELALSPSDLVGRDAERADLFAAFHRAISSVQPAAEPRATDSVTPPRRGEVVARAVVGEMGIGKTALASAFAAELPGETSVISVECSPVKSELPLSTVADLLRFVTGMDREHTLEAAEEALRGLLGGFARTPQGRDVIARLAELVTGKERARAEEEPAHYRRELVLSGIRHMLASLAGIQPLVIVIDGLQWADHASLELYRELVRRPAPLPILLLAVTRPEDRIAPFLEGMVRIELRGLGAEEQVRLVETRLGVREGVARGLRGAPAARGRQPVLPARDDRRAARARHARDRRPRARPRRRASAGGSRGDVAHERPRRRAGGAEARARAPRSRGGPQRALPSTLEQLIGDRLRELPTAERDRGRLARDRGGPPPGGDLLGLTRLADDEAIMRLCARGALRSQGLRGRFPAPARARRRLRRARARRPARACTAPLGEHLAQTPLAQGMSAAIVARHLARGEAPGPRGGLLPRGGGRGARGSTRRRSRMRYYLRALATACPRATRGASRRTRRSRRSYRDARPAAGARAHLEALRRVAGARAAPRGVRSRLLRTRAVRPRRRAPGRAACPWPSAPPRWRARSAVPALEVEAAACSRADFIASSATCRARSPRATGRSRRRPGRRPSCRRALRAEVLRRAACCSARSVAWARPSIRTPRRSRVFREVGARRDEARVKNSLAYAMFVQGATRTRSPWRSSSIQIDLSIGGRFQIAKTLTQHRPRLRAARRRARGARLPAPRPRRTRALRRPGRPCGHAARERAEILLELGDVDRGDHLVGDAGALNAVTGSAYDPTHERVVRAAARAQRRRPPRRDRARRRRRGRLAESRPS